MAQHSLISHPKKPWLTKDPTQGSDPSASKIRFKTQCPWTKPMVGRVFGLPHHYERFEVDGLSQWKIDRVMQDDTGHL